MSIPSFCTYALAQALYADSPSPNILTELFHAASHTSSTVMPLICAIAYATCGMVAGSFRPLTIEPLTNFSFLTALGRGGASFRNFADAWLGLISHCMRSVMAKVYRALCLPRGRLSRSAVARGVFASRHRCSRPLQEVSYATHRRTNNQLTLHTAPIDANIKAHLH